MNIEKLVQDTLDPIFIVVLFVNTCESDGPQDDKGNRFIINICGVVSIQF